MVTEICARVRFSHPLLFLRLLKHLKILQGGGLYGVKKSSIIPQKYDKKYDCVQSSYENGEYLYILAFFID